ncbi:restriction endonuclease subunit S [Cetobacterium sp. ZWU0022]|uniref:restriction endonuclease subunit S n=2 Tax=unclassified Cetobacterium TaxID=2630983 RepID=UPI0006467C16|nr:restriction endonuclease subunit S [Cetobacterium sp. ZWU0022]
MEEICLNITDGKHGNCKDEPNSGYFFISVKDINNGKINYDNARQITENDFLEVDKRTKLEDEDILITNSGTIGKMVFIKNNKKVRKTTFQKSVAIIKPNKDKVNSKYLYYVLSSKVNKLINLSGGSVQKNLLLKDLRKLEIDLPPLETQEKITSILSALDDKIEINNEMNKTLEEMAQTLFKRWFIDFDFPNENGEPYRSSGGKMVDSELGEIPEGWEVGNFENIGIIASGGTPSKSNEEYYTKNGIPWITPKDLSLNKNKFITKGSLDITEKGLAKSSTKLLPKGTVLFSSRAPIGYLAIAEVNVTTNQGFKSIIPNNSENTEFIYQLLKEITPHIESIAGGSTFKEISSQGMKSINITIPSDLILKKYFEITESFNKKIQNLEKEIQSLTEIRDTLLPKLMSGEVEV